MQTSIYLGQRVFTMAFWHDQTFSTFSLAPFRFDKEPSSSFNLIKFLLFSSFSPAKQLSLAHSTFPPLFLSAINAIALSEISIRGLSQIRISSLSLSTHGARSLLATSEHKNQFIGPTPVPVIDLAVTRRTQLISAFSFKKTTNHKNQQNLSWQRPFPIRFGRVNSKLANFAKSLYMLLHSMLEFYCMTVIL
jgi:hypothetical protein